MRNKRADVAALAVLSGLVLVPAAATTSAQAPIRVNGGTTDQRRELEAVLIGLHRPARIRQVQITLAGRPSQWPQSGVAIGIRTSTGRRGRWEAQLLADAFQERSFVRGLPPVVAIRWNGGETNMWGPRGWKPEIKPIDLPGSARQQLAARIRRAAASAKIEVRSVSVLQPYGLAVAIRLKVPRAASFLATVRLCRFKGNARLRDLHGYYIEVRDRRGIAAIEDSTRGPGLITSGSWSRAGIDSPCLPAHTGPAP